MAIISKFQPCNHEQTDLMRDMTPYHSHVDCRNMCSCYYQWSWSSVSTFDSTLAKNLLSGLRSSESRLDMQCSGAYASNSPCCFFSRNFCVASNSAQCCNSECFRVCVAPTWPMQPSRCHWQCVTSTTNTLRHMTPLHRRITCRS